MADQYTVSYLFQMRGDLMRKLNQLGREVKQTRAQMGRLGARFNQVERGATRAGTAVGRLAHKIRALRSVGHGMSGGGLLAGLMGGGVGAFGAGRMVQQFADYETALVNIRKVWTGSEEEYKRITQTLRKLNKEIPLTRAEIAQLTEEGIRAGAITSAEGAEAYTRLASKFATAFSLPVAKAAPILGKIKSQLSLTDKQFEELGDLMNTIANKFSLSEQDILEVIRRQGRTAQRLAGNQGVTDLITVTSAMIASGAQREVAATGIRTMLARLGTLPKTTKDALKSLGLSPERTQYRLSKDLYGTLLDIFERVDKLPTHRSIEVLSELAGLKSFNAIAPLVVDRLKEIRDVAQGQFRLTMQSEFERRIKSLNSLLQITRNHLSDFGDSLVQYWEMPIKRGLKAIRELSKDLKGNQWLAWAAGLWTIASALSLVLLPIGMLAFSMKALGPAAMVVAVALNRIAMTLALPFFAGLGAMVGYIARLTAAILQLSPALTGMVAVAARVVAGFTGIGVAILFWRELWEVIKGFFSTLATAYQGSELQQAISFLAKGIGDIVKGMGELIGLDLSGTSLKTFFDAGAAAAEALLNPLRTIKRLLGWITSQLPSLGSFGFGAEADLKRRMQGLKLPSAPPPSVIRRMSELNGARPGTPGVPRAEVEVRAQSLKIQLDKGLIGPSSVPLQVERKRGDVSTSSAPTPAP